MKRGLAGALLAALLSACSFSALDQNPLSGELSIEREKELTAEVHRQIRDQVGFINDPVVLEYVYELGHEIAAVTEPQPFIYRFFVIDDDALNAFTIGGGYVYINSATFAQAGDVSELAGLLAHEIGHVDQRHIARRGEGQGIATLLTLVTLAAAVASGGDAGAAAVAIGQGINVSLQLKNSRAHEAEADREGIAFMLAAGYDPEGLSRFFDRLLTAYGEPGNEVPDYLFTHPAVRERIAAVRVELERLGARAGGRRRDERLAEVQERLAALSEPIAGGTGLHSRAEFDRSVTDPLLERARATDDLERRAAILARAEAAEPNDPRVARALAEVAEARGDLEGARKALHRAVMIDPTVPLAQFELGVMHRRLDDANRAVFYLEQAANNFRPGSRGRRRAEFEILRIEFEMFERSGLTTSGGEIVEETSVILGVPVVWWASLGRRFLPHNPAFEITWTDPTGTVARSEKVRMNPAGRLRAAFSPHVGGTWTVTVEIDGSPVEAYRFDVAG